MNLKRSIQDKIALKAQYEELLIHLRPFGIEESPELARRLGYERNPFPKIKRGEINVSGNLLAGLKLLHELETLRRKPETKSLPEQVLEMQNQIADLKSALLGKYPERKPQLLQWNDQANCDPSGAAEQALAWRRLAEEQAVELAYYKARKLKARRKKASAPNAGGPSNSKPEPSEKNPHS